jgi:hypothetical protein
VAGTVGRRTHRDRAVRCHGPARLAIRLLLVGQEDSQLVGRMDKLMVERNCSNHQRVRPLVSYSASAAETSKRELEAERRKNLEIVKVSIFQKRGGRADGRG